MFQLFQKMMRGFHKGWWYIAGMCSLALGVIGAFLPILPTTPLIILAAFCFSKSSPKLQAWLEGSKTFGPIITDWRKTGAIAPKYKFMAVSMMAITFIASAIFGASGLVLIIQVVGMSLGAAYVLTRPNS
jgi:uncharacterized membrane protein YbaN (DUF454 family)